MKYSIKRRVRWVDDSPCWVLYRIDDDGLYTKLYVVDDYEEILFLYAKQIERDNGTD